MITSIRSSYPQPGNKLVRVYHHFTNLDELALVSILSESGHDEPNMQMQQEEVREVRVRELKIIEQFVKLHQLCATQVEFETGEAHSILGITIS